MISSFQCNWNKKLRTGGNLEAVEVSKEVFNLLMLRCESK